MLRSAPKATIPLFPQSETAVCLLAPVAKYSTDIPFVPMSSAGPQAIVAVQSVMLKIEDPWALIGCLHCAVGVWFASALLR